MSRPLRVLLLMHRDLIPPDSLEGLSDDQVDAIKTEYDVATGVEHLGHGLRMLGLDDEVAPLRQAIHEYRPHVVFNLLEEFRDRALFDYAVVAYLELMGIPYTGCNPRGLILARDKALSKKILRYHRIAVPQFFVVARKRKVKRPRNVGFPLIVKSLVEEASEGISQASVVYSDEKLAERVEFIHRRIGTDAIIEEFIEGREIYCGVLGNERLKAFPPWEMEMPNLPADAARIATRRIKWDLKYQAKVGVKVGPARLDPASVAKVQRTTKRIYRGLGMSGYGRVDFRLGENGRLYFLEANPNCDISLDGEFALASEAAGYNYRGLLQKLIALGRNRRRPA